MQNSTNPAERYIHDYEQVTGQRPSAFMCPILLEESAGVDLIDGHILPKALRDAAGHTVLQRADVDNFFGRTIEPALIEFLNSVTYTKADFLDRAKDVQIVSEKAGPLDLFIPSRKSQPPFPRIGLKDSKGATIASPHVKGTLNDLGGVSGSAEIQGSMSFHKPSIDGGMLKAAHLALFRLDGYRWALSASGRHVSAPLKQFFHSDGEQGDAETLFREFSNAFHVILADAFPFDTLADSTVLLHYHLEDLRSVDPFAVSCVFSVNDRKLLVTLPFCLNDDFQSKLSMYRNLMSNWHIPHRMVVTKLTKDGFEPQSTIGMRYTENPPPELIPPNRSDEE